MNIYLKYRDDAYYLQKLEDLKEQIERINKKIDWYREWQSETSFCFFDTISESEKENAREALRNFPYMELYNKKNELKQYFNKLLIEYNDFCFIKYGYNIINI